MATAPHSRDGGTFIQTERFLMKRGAKNTTKGFSIHLTGWIGRSGCDAVLGVMHYKSHAMTVMYHILLITKKKSRSVFLLVGYNGRDHLRDGHNATIFSLSQKTTRRWQLNVKYVRHRGNSLHWETAQRATLNWALVLLCLIWIGLDLKYLQCHYHNLHSL